ncbi:hypothetical protein NDN08_008294 [Rhodosorus marinus]|uniref:Uncharacterized protein n=1 Tax=Rhodosorus marinus TaxID=101924 RepID=A0AAV8V137_9RHOD|nr:hypothetical protein NDN08_008294 [Rhodosorus marinus]
MVRRAAWLCAFSVILVLAAADATEQTQVLLDTVKQLYGEQRANDVFKAVVDALEGKSMDPAEVAAVVNQKVEEMKKELLSGAMDGSNVETDKLTSQMNRMTGELMTSLKSNNAGKNTHSAALSLKNAQTTLQGISGKLSGDMERATRLIARVVKLADAIKSKQTSSRLKSREILSVMSKKSGGQRFRAGLYILFIVELLVLTMFAAFRKFSSRKKYSKLG